MSRVATFVEENLIMLSISMIHSFFFIRTSKILLSFNVLQCRHTTFEGEIKYVNKALQEYIIHFSDGSRDFVKEANFNETDLYFC